MSAYFQTRWFRYFVAIATTLIALLVRLQSAWLFETASFMPFFMAILISAWIGGWKPGVLATGLGAVAGVWFLLEPVGSLAIVDRADAIQLLLYLVMGLAISLVCQWLHNARDRASAMRSDITELQHMEENLRRLAADLAEADRRKDRFLATLSHELRNPLAPIRNSLELMKRSPRDAAMVDIARAAMERQLVQMVRLVDDLLDVSRITRDKLELRRSIVTLQSVLDNAIEAAHPSIVGHGHQLSVTLPPQTVWLNVDPARTAQVFSNLLNNAAKYTEDGGMLQLVARADADEVVVSVIDNGVGVPAQQVSTVLEMFGQVDSTLDRSEGGLGIGLSLAKRLVEMHNGRIDLRAGPDGQGTEVEVRLAAVTPPLGHAAAVAAASAPAGEVRAFRVLVADDNVDSAQTLAMMLDMLGHQTRSANDGMEAVRVAREFQPDLVLLDIGMPRLNGYDACRQIREQAWATAVTMVAVTGWGQDEDRRRSKDAGFDLHLIKPLDPLVVERMMRELKSGSGATLLQAI